MFRSVAVLVFAMSLALPTRAVGAWHIGPNFGFSRVWANGEGLGPGEGASLVNWGSGSNMLGVSQPGMRVGWSIAGDLNEVYAATGLDVISGGSGRETAYAVTATVNYQRNVSDRAFATGGVGIFSLGDGTTSASVPIFGGGIGYLHPIATGHGRFRWEVRFDHQAEDVGVGLPSTNLITIRLGFDLMMQ